MKASRPRAARSSNNAVATSAFNEDKTHLRRLPDESFDFLGYTFGLCYSKTGRRYLGQRPSKQKVQAIVDGALEVRAPDLVARAVTHNVARGAMLQAQRAQVELPQQVRSPAPGEPVPVGAPAVDATPEPDGDVARPAPELVFTMAPRRRCTIPPEDSSPRTMRVIQTVEFTLSSTMPATSSSLSSWKYFAKG